jgi:hypothetical protein
MRCSSCRADADVSRGLARLWAMGEASGVDNGAIWQDSNPDHIIFQSEAMVKGSFPLNRFIRIYVILPGQAWR